MRTKALSFCCASAVFLSKTVPFLAVRRAADMRIPTKTSGWRKEGAMAIKFEFVLTLTKNVLPLLMVIATGQVRSRKRHYTVFCPSRFHSNCGC
eukprot:SAG22_NODE_13_length_33548_cov_57.167773_28_plen_94_part_00